MAECGGDQTLGARLEVTVSGSDLDPESVRQALHDFVQRFNSVRRDMEDAQSQVQSLQSRLDEQAEQTEQWARRLHQVQQALCEVEAGRWTFLLSYSYLIICCF